MPSASSSSNPIALPIALGLVDPRSPLSLATLDDLEKIRAERWHGDGYMRYASTCELNQIGPWPFATCFVLRAQHDAGLFDRWQSAPGGDPADQERQHDEDRHQDLPRRVHRVLELSCVGRQVDGLLARLGGVQGQ